MMKYKNTAIPAPWEGVSFEGIPDEVVPDQSMSLQEIIERFTRGEPVAVGKEGHYGDDDVDTDESYDASKMASADLVDQAEFIEAQKEIVKAWERQEAKKKAAEKKAADEAAKKAEEERIAKAAEELVKKKTDPK